MEWWQALVLGLVEGITEYLPVSSTGHLVVAQRLIGIEASEAANAYVVAIQAGAILAVLTVYRARIQQIIQGLFGRNTEGAHLLRTLIAAFVPAAVLGLLFDEMIERYLFGIWPVVAAWAAGGVLLFVLQKRLSQLQGTALETLSLRAGFVIGVAQCAALWPGVSRSLATILGGLAMGLSLPATVEFSFLLGLLTLGAATGYKTLKSGAVMLDAYGPLPLAVGVVVAWLSAILAVRWMVAQLSKHGLGVFAWWRLGMAALVCALHWAGTI